jgi:hypothetical protein
MTYNRHLPYAFPHVVDMTRHDAKRAIALLLEANSSFAITTEYPGTLRLWLSEASYHFLLTTDFSEVLP